MLTRYLQPALRRATYPFMEDSPRFYGELPDCPGVYATGETLEACREELSEVLDERALFRVSRSLPLPVLDPIELKIREVA